jgi:ribosomal protein L24
LSQVPDSMLVYDREAKPVVSEYVLIISGADKGRTGRLIGISEASGKGVVKVERIRAKKPPMTQKQAPGGGGSTTVSSSSSSSPSSSTASASTPETTDAPFEIKVVDMVNLAKTIPDKPVDAQMKSLMMCPRGLSLTTQGFKCKY